MKCNHCHAELEEGVVVCPVCGWDNAAQEAAAEETLEALVEETAREPELQEAPVEETEQESEQQEAPVEETAEEPDMTEQEGSQEPSEDEGAPIVEGKLTPGKIALLVVLAVAAIAVIVALVMSSLGGNDTVADPGLTQIEGETEGVETLQTEQAEQTEQPTVPADGNPDDVTCKGSYSASDEEVVANKDTVVATIGDEQLTNSELQVYYWMQIYDFMSNYGSYAMYFGLDYAQGLDTQMSLDGSGTWQQYFLNAALNTWHSYKALELEANEAGFELQEEYQQYLDTLADTLETSAQTSGYEDAQAMLQADMGVGADIDSYVSYMRESYISYQYYNDLCSKVKLTEAEIEAYFDENSATYAENGVEKNDERYVDVRHILVVPQGGTTAEDGTVTYSEEEWETCHSSAQAILDAWMEGDATEDSFAALANEKSEDGGSNTNGGLYEDVYVGQMVEPFEKWCFDESRSYGDTGLVQTDYGYHVMYFIKSAPVWYATAEKDMYDAKNSEIVENSMADKEMQVDYSSIVLGVVDLSTQ